MQEKLLTVKEVAELLQVDEQTVYRRKDEIGYSKPFGQIRFRREDVEVFLQKTRVEPLTNERQAAE
jgi:excisionase family DNA binding protein